MSSLVEATQLIRALVGGGSPETGDAIVFTEKGWRFDRNHWRGVVTADPADLQDGDIWFNSTDSKLRVSTSGGVYESAAFTLVP